MVEIEAAIASLEYDHASTHLSSSNIPSPAAENVNASHDVLLAEEAYRGACVALASGRPDAAIRSIRVAFATCPPDKTSAVAKLSSLSSIAFSKLQKQKQYRQ